MRSILSKACVITGIAISSTGVVLSSSVPALGITFSQTLRVEETSTSGYSGGQLAPMTYSFGPLAPVAPTASGFSLDLMFKRLDLNSRFEFLTTLVDANGTNYNLGKFTTTNTGCNIFNCNGTGSKFIDFASIGGVSNFTAPFQISLQPSKYVQAYYGYYHGPKGYADLTLSYTSTPPSDVPEPMTILGTLLAGGYGIHLKRKKNKLAASTGI